MVNHPNRKLDSKARSAARSAGLMACKSRRSHSVDNCGGYMLVDPNTNSVVAGTRFNLSAEDVLEYCKPDVSEQYRLIE